MNADYRLLLQQRTGIGAFMLIVLGVLLLAHNAMPIELHEGPVHAALILGSIAAFFGTIWAFDGRRRWVRIPAVFFASVAAVIAFAAWPWHGFSFGLGMPGWPLLLVALGVWMVYRDRRLA